MIPQPQPTSKCRPPADTPIGAFGWLSNGAVEILHRWTGRRWESTIITGRSHPPSALARRGWWLARLEPVSLLPCQASAGTPPATPG